MQRAQTIAVRAVNQYRKRDILPYIGLRYYLENSSARRDRWAHDVAIYLTLNRAAPIYFEANHFKDVLANGQVNHRKMHLPGPNEALAEAALIDICSKHPSQFNSLDCVFSYRLARDNQRDGIFEPYFKGFKERHIAVSSACKENNEAIVRYLDIKRFYPNISTKIAENAWSSACDNSKLPEIYRELGYKLLHDHAVVSMQSDGNKSVLTGPAFSHLIANLILHEVDVKMADAMPKRYFRYVDDVIVIGTNQEVERYRSLLLDCLGELGLELHDGEKDFMVSSSDWLEGEFDFSEQKEFPSWMTLVGNLKRYLVVNGDVSWQVRQVLLDNDFRLPIPEYSADIQESSYLSRLLRYSKSEWMKYQIRNIDINSILHEAILLRNKFEVKLVENIDGILNLSGYKRKRMIPKLRYVAGRMLFLANTDQLSRFAPELKSISETRLLGEVFEAVSTRDASRLVEFGINAVQSAAQVLRLSSQSVHCDPKSLGSTELQGLSILKLNGISVEDQGLHTDINSDLLNFATKPGVNKQLMKSNDAFISEIASLHGVSEESRHSQILDSAFDPDEQMAFDAINQLKPSSY
ncbi:MAG: RNA-directed DNA polymerase [Gammaproteobacteria bacterium]|nr:RNA-directed DNA polymerase [Gammaproteobacteria bacterium]